MKNVEPTVIRLLEGVFLVTYPTVKHMTKAFMRVQEYYENPKFSGIRDITCADIDRDYVSLYDERYGDMVVGCNVPGDVFCDFFLTAKRNAAEQRLIDAIASKLTYGEQVRYVIGAQDGHTAIAHEIAHVLYYCIPEYRSAMDDLILNIPPTLLEKCFKPLKESPIITEVQVSDELQASMATGLAYGLEDIPEITAQTPPFVDLFMKCVKEFDLVEYVNEPTS